MLEVTALKIMVGAQQEIKLDRKADQKVFTNGQLVLVEKQAQVFDPETKTVLKFQENVIFDLSKAFGWSYVVYAEPVSGTTGSDIQSVPEAATNIEGTGI